MRPRLVFLETSDIGARYLAGAARALGAEPLFLCELSAYQADPLAALLAEPHVDTRTSEPAALEALLRARGEPVLGVATLADHRLVTAVALAERLGVQGLDPAVVPLKDKARVAELVGEHSPRTLAFRREEIPDAALEELLRASGALLVKPRRGAGGVGVIRVEGGAVRREVADHVRHAKLPASVDDGDWIAQAFVAGPMVSVEGFRCGGQLRLLGLTDRRRIGGTESGSRFPVEIASERRRDVERAVEALVERAGFERGWFHVEFVIDHERAWLVDANMGRLGGGPIGDLLSVAFDVDPTAVYRHVLEVSLSGQPAEDPFPREVVRSAFAAVYGMRRGGRLGSVVLPPGLTSRHVAVLGPGARVPAMGTDDWAWVGMLTGRDGDVQREMERVLILGEEGPEAPCW